LGWNTRIGRALSSNDHLSFLTPWFEEFSAKKSDAAPMQCLAERHPGSEAGFQRFRNPAYAGKGTLTLIVGGL
jgi:hypothetical protein